MNFIVNFLLVGFVCLGASLPSKDNTRGDITTIIKDCGSTGGKIVSITLEGCNGDEVDVCELKKGETVRGQLTFEATKATTKLDCEIFGIIGGVALPFPGGCPVKDGCSALTTGNCPIEASETFVYNMEMFIEPLYPSVRVDGKWILKDESRSQFVCFIVPLKIA